MNKYRRTSDRLVKKKWGGLIGTAVGAGAGAFVGNPMLGASVGGALGGGIDSMTNKPNKITQPKTTGTGNMGYKYGGNIKQSLPKYPKGGQMRKIGPNAAAYNGPSHEAGGIPIDAQGNPNKSNPVAEIEGGETRQNDFIFSDELMVPGTEMSFAEAHEMLLQEGAEEADIEELAMMQEQVKQEQGISNDGSQAPQQQMADMQGEEQLPMMEDGGNMFKTNNNQRIPNTVSSDKYEQMTRFDEALKEASEAAMSIGDREIAAQLAQTHERVMSNVENRNLLFSGQQGGRADYTEPFDRMSNRSEPTLNMLSRGENRIGDSANDVNQTESNQNEPIRRSRELSNENVTNSAFSNRDESIIDLLKSQGKDSSFKARKKLAKAAGIENYKGTAEQNIALLKIAQNNPVLFRSRENEEAVQNSLNQGVPGQPRYMKYGGRLKKKVNTFEAGGVFTAANAQRYAPSVIDAGMALFSKKPKKVTPNTMTPTTIDKDRSNYNDTKSNIGRSARTAISGGANPQATHATTLRGLSSAAASQNQYESSVDAQNAGIINNAQSQNAQLQYQADVRNNENSMKDKASRINLMRNAITRPLDMNRQDAQLKEQRDHDMNIALMAIEDPAERRRLREEFGLTEKVIQELETVSPQRRLRYLSDLGLDNNIFNSSNATNVGFN